MTILTFKSALRVFSWAFELESSRPFFGAAGRRGGNTLAVQKPGTLESNLAAVQGCGILPVTFAAQGVTFWLTCDFLPVQTPIRH